MSGPLGAATRGRLLISGPGEADQNMAIDAAILQCASPGDGPTLRFYSWREPTLSLGYFQPISQRTLHPESQPLAVVRRATGGGAIVHDRELTYSLVAPSVSQVAGAAPDVYRAVHDAIAASLADFGIQAVRFAASALAAPQSEPFLCFQRRTSEDLIVNGYKVLGSAQRRTGQALLQHGSLLQAASPAAPQLPGLAELCGRTIGSGDLIAAVSAKLSSRWATRWFDGELTPAEQSAIAPLASGFADEAWTRKT